jgi:hypothetical protein
MKKKYIFIILEIEEEDGKDWSDDMILQFLNNKLKGV